MIAHSNVSFLALVLAFLHKRYCSLQWQAMRVVSLKTVLFCFEKSQITFLFGGVGTLKYHCSG